VVDASQVRLTGAYASSGSNGGVALYGTAGSLRRLASHIRSDGDVRLASPPPETIEAAALHTVRVVPGDGPVELRVVGDSIEVTGRADLRAKLAASVENLASEAAFGGVVARHIDLEYFPDHGFLSERSEWMTVTLLTTQGQ
jgi:hypothetical protein